MIRQAVLTDLPRILAIKSKAIANMHTQNIDQWNDEYPSEAILTQDIADGSLYIVANEQTLTGFACIDTNQSPEYLDLTWETEPVAYLIHRLAIDPDQGGKGYASELFTFAETLAKTNNVHAMRIDTYCKNTLAQNLFLKMGYTYVGNVHFTRKPEPFYCYEKKLN